MPLVISVNIGAVRSVEGAGDVTGIDKRPVDGPVQVRPPDPRGAGGSGLVGDEIGDLLRHGGDDQAVYAYAREDLDRWADELGRPLSSGAFGENITTSGIDVNEALIGERWRVGNDLVLEVTAPRIPCRTFAAWLDERQWVKRFTRHCWPGAYLRVIQPGVISSGDSLTVIHRPEHDVTVAVVFRSRTTEPELRPRVAAALATGAAGELIPEEKPFGQVWLSDPLAARPGFSASAELERMRNEERY